MTLKKKLLLKFIEKDVDWVIYIRQIILSCSSRKWHVVLTWIVVQDKNIRCTLICWNVQINRNTKLLKDWSYKWNKQWRLTTKKLNLCWRILICFTITFKLLMNRKAKLKVKLNLKLRKSNINFILGLIHWRLRIKQY